MRNSIILSALFGCCLIFVMPQIQAAGLNDPATVDGQVIVKYKTAPTLDTAAGKGLRKYRSRTGKPLAKILSRHKLEGVQPLFSTEAAVLKRNGSARKTALEQSRLHRLVFPKNADTNQIITELKQLPGVEYAEPNYIGGMSYLPADPIYGNSQNDFDIINMQDAWNTQFGSTSTLTIAIIDSGIETIHPELSGAIDLVNSFNVYDNNNLIFDDIGHGTRVAGIIAAAESNGIGTAGIAFGCKLQSYDVASTTGFLTTADVTQAVNLASANGADIINMSLRFFGFSQSLKNACDAAYASGILIVASAGNEGQAKLRTYPAGLSSVIGVGCVLDDGTTRAFWSNYNDIVTDLVEIVAPGETVFSTIPGEQYNGTLGNGTSFASPMVAGAAALLMSKNPTQSVVAIREHLNQTAAALPPGNDPVGWDGNGLLDVKNALDTPMAVLVEIESIQIDDRPALSGLNDDDGAADILETIEIFFVLKSLGADVANVSATLSSTDGGIGIIQGPTAFLGNLQSGGSIGNPGNPIGPIPIISTVGARKLNFTLTLSNGAGFNQVVNFNIPMEHEVFAQGAITGNLAANRTHHFDGDANIFGILTIEPGTIIKLDPGVSFTLDPSAILIADGNSTNPIIFTTAQLSTANWGDLVIPNLANGGSLTFCEFERGGSIISNHDSFVIQDCKISQMSSVGLAINFGTGGPDLLRITSDNNGAAGIIAGGRKAIDCTATGNVGIGIGQASTIFNCKAIQNQFGGLEGNSVFDSEATSNTQDGIVATADIANCTAFANGLAGIISVSGTITSCTSQNNGGPGIHLQTGGVAISGCRALNNQGGGIIAEISLIENCEAEFNQIFAIQGNAVDTEVRNCRVTGNLFGTFSNVATVTDCIVTDNLLDGVGGSVSAVSGSIISGNAGFGVTGSVANLSNSSIYGNLDTGVLNVASVNNCWIVNNFNGGFEATELGIITNTSILDNRPFGINSALQVNNSNIFGNEIFQAEDTNGSGAATRDYTGNFWGTANTVELNANLPNTNRTFINDSFDGQSNTLDVWPFSPTQLSVPNTALTPTFLLSISPNILEAIQNDPAKIQKTTFTLTFSKAMNTAINPVVTFGVAPPFTTHIVLPEGGNGWLDSRTWQGFFDIGGGDGNGLNTYRVAGAIDASGFALPDDTTRLFFIDTGSLSANNGLAAGLSTTRMRVNWSNNSKPPGTKGFNVRSKVLADPGTFSKINTTILAAASSQYEDSGLASNTIYAYVIDIVDNADHSTQWTPPFIGTTLTTDPPVIDLNLLRTHYWELLE